MSVFYKYQSIIMPSVSGHWSFESSTARERWETRLSKTGTTNTTAQVLLANLVVSQCDRLGQ